MSSQFATGVGANGTPNSNNGGGRRLSFGQRAASIRNSPMLRDGFNKVKGKLLSSGNGGAGEKRRPAKPSKLHGGGRKFLGGGEQMLLMSSMKIIIAHLHSRVSSNDMLWGDADTTASESLEDAKAIVKAVKNDGGCASLLNSLGSYSKETLAHVIKLGFQSSDDPLVGAKASSTLSEMADVSDIAALQDMLKLVTKRNVELMGSLCALLNRIGTPKQKLAYSFGPLLFLPRFDNENRASMEFSQIDVLKLTSSAVKAMESLILKCDQVFDLMSNAEMENAGRTELQEHAAGTTFPQQPLKARVEYDFVAEDESEIDVVEGEIVYVIEAGDDGWHFGTNAAGKEGLFPSEFVVLLDDEQQHQQQPQQQQTQQPRQPGYSPERKVYVEEECVSGDDDDELADESCEDVYGRQVNYHGNYESNTRDFEVQPHSTHANADANANSHPDQQAGTRRGSDASMSDTSIGEPENECMNRPPPLPPFKPKILPMQSPSSSNDTPRSADQQPEVETSQAVKDATAQPAEKVDKLEKEVVELKEQLLEIMDQYDSERQTVEGLQQQVTELNSSNETLQQQIQDMQEAHTKEIAQLKAKHEEETKKTFEKAKSTAAACATNQAHVQQASSSSSSSSSTSTSCSSGDSTASATSSSTLDQRLAQRRASLLKKTPEAHEVPSVPPKPKGLAASGGNQASGSGSSVDKYEKMRKMGLPEAAIEHARKKDSAGVNGAVKDTSSSGTAALKRTPVQPAVKPKPAAPSGNGANSGLQAALARRLKKVEEG